MKVGDQVIVVCDGCPGHYKNGDVGILLEQEDYLWLVDFSQARSKYKGGRWWVCDYKIELYKQNTSGTTIDLG